jgi:hypothetical protein
MSRKRVLLPTLLAALGLASLEAQTLSQSDRDYAMSLLHGSRKEFIDTLAKVSDTQWSYKPSPTAWSVGEIAEHLALSEDLIFQRAMSAMKEPATTGPRNTRAADDKILAMLRGRAQKASAPEVLVPKKAFATREALVAAFKTARDRNTAYVRETKEDLRGHAAPHPVFGPVDCYQWLLVISGHTDRHLAQMREVMASPGYPAN